jgi:hypothetical protein
MCALAAELKIEPRPKRKLWAQRPVFDADLHASSGHGMSDM